MSHTRFSFDEDSSLDAAAENLVERMPEPSEDAVAAMGASVIDPAAAPATAPAAPTPAPSAPQPARSSVSHPMNGQKDKHGVLFDAEKHTGSLLKNGHWRERKKRTSTVVTGTQPDAAAIAAQSNAHREQQSRAAGIAAAGLTFMTCTAIGGAEWKPRDIPIDEKSALEQAYGDYFVSKNVTDFPPGVALAIALTMYAAPRFVMPETRSRMSRMKTWAAAKVANWKLRREAKKRGISIDELREEMGLAA